MNDLIITVNIAPTLLAELKQAVGPFFKIENIHQDQLIDFSKKHYDLLQAVICQGSVDGFESVLVSLKSSWKHRFVDVVYLGELGGFNDGVLFDYLGIRKIINQKSAGKVLNSLISTWINSSRQKHILSRFEYQLGSMLEKAQFEFAHQIIVSMKEIDPWFERMTLYIALILIQKKEWTEALRYLEPMIKNQPHYLEALVAYGFCKLKSGQFEEGMVLLQKIEVECKDNLGRFLDGPKAPNSYAEDAPLNFMAKLTDDLILSQNRERFLEGISESLLKSSNARLKKENKVTTYSFQKPKPVAALNNKKNARPPILDILSLQELLQGSKMGTQALKKAQTDFMSKTLKVLDENVSLINHSSKKKSQTVLFATDDIVRFETWFSKINVRIDEVIHYCSMEEFCDRARVGDYQVLGLVNFHSVEGANQLIEDYLSALDLEMVPFAVLFAESAKLTEFNLNSRHLLYESSDIIPEDSSGLIKNIERTYANFNHPANTKHRVRGIRQVFKNLSLKLISSSDARDLVQGLVAGSVVNQTQIWIDIELIAHAHYGLLTRSQEVQLKTSLKAFPKKFLRLQLSQYLYHFKSDYRLFEPFNIQEIFFASDGINSEKALQFGLVLLMTNDISGLHRLLDYWLKNKDLYRGIGFEWFYALCIQKFERPQIVYAQALSNIVAKYPLFVAARIEFASILVIQGFRSYAIEIIKSSGCSVNSSVFENELNLKLIESLYVLDQKEVAFSLCQNMLKKFPGSDRLNPMLRSIMDQDYSSAS